MGKSTDSTLIDKYFSLYLTRYATHVEYLKDHTPEKELRLIVTIPCYKESGLLNTLESLHKCASTKYPVEVIVLINQPAGSPEETIQQNEIVLAQSRKWAGGHSTPKRKFHIIWGGDLPAKHAGVGLARKMVMDEAIRRFSKSGQRDGIITSLDADSVCDANYLSEIERNFLEDPEFTGANIYFEHHIPENKDDRTSLGIASYELHLRYMVHALRIAGYPYAFHSVGSTMAVRASSYLKQGGMNRRKAGEDFYFLQKIIPLGNFGEINTTRVIPSARVSDRVPFGTGKAMMKWLNSDATVFETYNPQIYDSLKQLFTIAATIYHHRKSELQPLYHQLENPLKKFIKPEEWDQKMKHIKDHSTSIQTYRYKFFQWMDGLKILKYIHYARDEAYPNVPVLEAYNWIRAHLGLDTGTITSVFEGLEELRSFDRANPWYYRKNQVVIGGRVL